MTLICVLRCYQLLVNAINLRDNHTNITKGKLCFNKLCSKDKIKILFEESDPKRGTVQENKIHMKILFCNFDSIFLKLFQPPQFPKKI